MLIVPVQKIKGGENEWAGKKSCRFIKGQWEGKPSELKHIGTKWYTGPHKLCNSDDWLLKKCN